MARFYGTVKGSGVTQATRQGNDESGIKTQAASWSGAIEVFVYRNTDNQHCYLVNQIPWKGTGKNKTISSGIF